jgi:hypothetical protein
MKTALVIIMIKHDTSNFLLLGEQKISNEPLALEALKHFHDVPKYGTKLVPEHIETRALFTSEKPGVEQGKLEMWIDLFPKITPPDSPPVDVSPRLPKR